MDVQGLSHITALGGWGFGGAENSWGGFLVGIKKPAWAGLGGVGGWSALVDGLVDLNCSLVLRLLVCMLIQYGCRTAIQARVKFSFNWR